MGMFDWVEVEKDIIIENKDFQNIIIENNNIDWEGLLHSATYQTKCLENCLLNYKIDSNKQLTLNSEIVSITKSINFYDFFEEKSKRIWVEFIAKFHRGKMKKLNVWNLTIDCETGRLRTYGINHK